ncbi:peptide N-acetyl-beta-D-glucosaminyl asparaginase amidase A-domain-containing protein [Vararia minispora EC-137]|uniref:Peptide N-acetyl-beta-D-glucosaminyl asparaginase amidase A-domain-containing protein n=1 Tax=Vararia minispora EC-137 TaxID=1314806 RepID=A0ACB8QHM6_9AGAM|nr:peptide N-acetyl-beta-D-glucosaminyl asparaginase amidase A-domain-containing protein [Vararia minispora EC-137]
MPHALSVVVGLQTLFAASALWFGFVRGLRLVDFQVAQPPPLPKNAQQCTTRILEYVTFVFFPSSSNEGFSSRPPTDCGEPGSWAGISLNFTVTSNGTQFDRLGIFTFQNVEIWRTSTPEPTSGDGIIWQYLKDVTRFLPLFAKPGTFILQLDNLIQTGLNGEYATILDATFFASSSENPPAPRADLIVPITTLANNTGNDASVPPGFSLNITLPRNAVTAYVEMQASGNGNEEFWYFNAPNQFLNLLPNGFTFGNGPFREVRFLVDGIVAGVAFPYAVIFTGGIVPTAWRPITSYGAIDLPTYHFDLTPFIPILTDGHLHNITLDVASAEASHSINQNWFVSGLLQVQLDSSDKPTTGSITVYQAGDFATPSSTGGQQGNDVTFTVAATRSIHIESEIIAGSGTTTTVVLDQKLVYSNTQTYLNNFNVQLVNQSSSGTTLSTHNGRTVLQDKFDFPFFINVTTLNANGSDFVGLFDHGYDRELLPAPFILGSTIGEHQVSSGAFAIRSTGNIGSNGTSDNTFSYSDTAGNTFRQTVSAHSNVITQNIQGGSLAPSPLPDPVVPGATPAPTLNVMAKARLPGGRNLG